jgi:hypothetical protein
MNRSKALSAFLIFLLFFVPFCIALFRLLSYGIDSFRLYPPSTRFGESAESGEAFILVFAGVGTYFSFLAFLRSLRNSSTDNDSKN